MTQKMTRILAMVAMLVLSLATPRLAAQPCEPAWAEGFGYWGIDGIVRAQAVFDDGRGPALYVGGEFTDAGGVAVDGIARWDGSHWSTVAGPDGLGLDQVGYNAVVYALTVFDDGTGPALYAAGEFMTAGGVTVKDIARWDGSAWSALTGPGGTGVSTTLFAPTIRALAVFDDGSGPALYAGGWFHRAGGVTVNHIAKWDGSDWSPLAGPSGTGADTEVFALTVFDDGTGPALYAGGWFLRAGGVTVNRIAKWDGSVWSPLTGPSGTGANSDVLALAVFDDGTGSALYAGGSFTTAGGVPVNRIARWDGSAWSPLTGPSGTGASHPVYALTVFDDGMGPALYAGGNFTIAGGVTVNRIAKWDGSAWSPLTGPSGTGVNRQVFALTVFDDSTGPALYAGGDFETACGATANSIAKWDGSVLLPLAGPSEQGMDDDVLDLTVFDDGSGPALYAGGWFSTAGGMPAKYIAKWHGGVWSPLTGPSGQGLSGFVYAQAVFDDGTGPALYAAGEFSTAGGVTVNNIARWDGSAWSALSAPGGTGVEHLGSSPEIHALTVFDDGSGPALYAGGWFTTAGGVTVNGIARWDGSTWSPLTGPSGTGVSSSVEALTVFDDGTGPALYAGGAFTTAGGVTARYIAKWDGSTWSPLTGPSGTGVDYTVVALTVFDDGSGPALYAGGWFATAGGVTVNCIAKWDGSSWSGLTATGGTGVGYSWSALPVHTLAVFDDGTGSALYAGGNFTPAGGVTVNRIAKWDGSVWSPLAGPAGTGMSSTVSALAAFDDGTGPALYAGGGFTTAGGVPSEYIAKWTSCPPNPSCNPADLAEPFDTLDLADIVAFVTAFGNMAPDADLAEPFGLFDLADLLAFVTAFGAGCP